MRRPNYGELSRPRAAAVWAALALWLLSFTPTPASAQVRPASDPIVGKRLQNLLGLIPGSPTDLPPYLVKAQDVYLLVTAGGAYTDIQLLANPEVPPQKVATALSSALNGTALAGQTVEWSADRYSAAQVSVHHSRFGAAQATNPIALGPILAGLRRSGLTPHLLLRVPVHARLASVPVSHYGTRNFRWYDAARLSGQSSVTVTARITWISFARIIGYYLLIPIISLLGLWLAHVLIRRGQRDDSERRQLFRQVSLYAVSAALLVQIGGMVYLLRTPTPAAFADLWLGSSTTTNLVPFLVAAPLSGLFFLLLARKQELRRFGPLPTSPTIPMSDEEKAVRKRVTQWSALPHLIGAIALGVSPFFVPRTSLLYTYIHPLTTFLPLLGGGLVAALLQTRLRRFTQKTKEDDLTWRARQFGQQLGVRMPNVFIEDSSRAAHLIFALTQGHHITLSRKLAETFSSAEIDFILAHHLACMKRREMPTNERGALLLILLLVTAPLPFFWSRLVPVAPTPTAFILSPWFYPALGVYLLLWAIVLMMTIPNSTANEIRQATDADRNALELTGNFTAAMGALDKLDVDPALAMMRSDNSYMSSIAKKAETVQAARLILRRKALEETAQKLQFTAAPSAPSNLSPFTSPNNDNQTIR